MQTSPISSVLPPAPVTPSVVVRQLDDDNNKEGLKPLFFTTLFCDQYLDLTIKLGVSSLESQIKKEYRNFIPPCLDQEALAAFNQSLDKELRITGRRSVYPLSIKVTKRELLQNARKKAQDLGVDHSGLIRYHGSDLYAKLPHSYKKKVFASFFHPFKQEIQNADKLALIEPQEREEVPPSDSDYQIRPEPATKQTCYALIDALVDLFQKRLDIQQLSGQKIATYLQKLKCKVENQEGHAYLKSILQDPETLKPEHPLFLHTLIKVNGFTRACDIDDALKDPQFKKNIFFIRSFGNTEEEVDLIYRVSTARQKVFSALAVDIEPLLDDPNAQVAPFAPDGSAFQLFHDRQAQTLTSGDPKAYEAADFERYVIGCTNGKRSRETGKGIHCIAIIIEQAQKERVSISFYLSKKLQKMAHVHHFKSAERLIALTFNACLLLYLKNASYQEEIRQIWQAMFRYLDESERPLATSPFVKVLRSALENPFLSFADIFHQLQRSCYITLNFTHSLAIAPINHEWPAISLKFSPFYHFLIPYQPQTAFTFPEEPKALEMLKMMEETFNPFRSFNSSQSLLKPYCEHPDIHFKEIKIQAIERLGHPNRFIHSQACWILLSCLHQKFEEEIFKHLLLHLCDRQMLETLIQLCQGGPWEAYFKAGSEIVQAYFKMLSKPADKRFNAQIKIILALLKTNQLTLVHLALSLYKMIFIGLTADQQKSSLQELLKLLLPQHPEEAFETALLTHESVFLDCAVKLNVWLFLVLHLSKVESKSFQVAQCERVSQEILHLLRLSSFKLEKVVPQQQKGFLWLIQESIHNQQWEQGHALVSLGLHHHILTPSSALAELWFKIIQAYLQQKAYGKLLAYQCWDEGQAYNIWKELNPNDKNLLFSQLFEQNIGDPEQVLHHLISHPSNQESLQQQTSLLFLKFIEEKLNGDLSHLEASLFAFTGFIRRNRPCHLEKEFELAFRLLTQIERACPSGALTQKQTQLLSTFLSYLIENRSSNYLEEMLLNMLGSYIEKKQRALVSVFFEKSLIYLYRLEQASTLSTRSCQAFFALFNRAFDLYSSLYPLPISIKQQLQPQAIGALLDLLQVSQMSKELIVFLIKLKHGSLTLPFAEKYLDCALHYLQSFEEQAKDDVQLYLKGYSIDHSKFSVLLTPIYFDLARAYIKNGQFIVAKSWIEKCKPLKNDSAIDLLILQNAWHLMQAKQVQLGLEQLRLVAESGAPVSEVGQAWERLMVACAEQLPTNDCLALLLKYKAFLPFLSDLTLIDKLISALIKEHLPHLVEETHLAKKSLDKSLTLAFSVLEHLTFRNDKTWIRFLYLSATCKESKFRAKAFETMLKHHRSLSAEALPLGWKIVFKGIKNIGHEKLKELVNSDSLIPLIDSKNLEERIEIQRFFILSLLATLEEEKQRDLFKNIVKVIERLAFTPAYFSKTKDQLKWAQFLLWTQQEESILQAIDLWSKAIDKIKIDESNGSALTPFLNRLFVLARQAPALAKPTVELLAKVCQYAPLTPPIFLILEHLSKYEKEYHAEKILALSYLFHHPDLNDGHQRHLIHTLLQQLVASYEKGSQVRCLIQHKNINLFLTNDQIRRIDLTLQSQTSKWFFKLFPLATEMIYKADRMNFLKANEEQRGVKEKRKKIAIREEMREEYLKRWQDFSLACEEFKQEMLNKKVVKASSTSREVTLSPYPPCMVMIKVASTIALFAAALLLITHTIEEQPDF